MATNQEMIDALSDAVVASAEGGVEVETTTTAHRARFIEPDKAFELQEKIEAKEARQTTGACRYRAVFE